MPKLVLEGSLRGQTTFTRLQPVAVLPAVALD